jgi:hypothetical protein
MARFEAEVTIEQLQSGTWYGKAGARLLGRNATTRSREFRCGSYSALFHEIEQFLDELQPPAEPAI